MAGAIRKRDEGASGRDNKARARLNTSGRTGQESHGQQYAHGQTYVIRGSGLQLRYRLRGVRGSFPKPTRVPALQYDWTLVQGIYNQEYGCLSRQFQDFLWTSFDKHLAVYSAMWS